MNDDSTIQQITDVLENIRPSIQMDGGDVSLVRFTDGVVYIRLSGACVGCPAATYTVKLGIEQAMMNEIPSVQSVELVDDDDFIQ